MDELQSLKEKLESLPSRYWWEILERVWEETDSSCDGLSSLVWVAIDYIDFSDKEKFRQVDEEGRPTDSLFHLCQRMAKDYGKDPGIRALCLKLACKNCDPHSLEQEETLNFLYEQGVEEGLI